mmetsp:Transcript_64790/g.163129  ORF Transcript_64790/g.163129 Transcript_64790/m.163129 type:complete len:561 (-) Transcript_64790:187-1869(-)
MLRLLLGLSSILSAACFELNAQNTTPWGPPWADAILSAKADFVVCRGHYALCFYAQCEPRVAAGGWIQGLAATADCPCEVHSGLYAVMVNAILDKEAWQATREHCPMGGLSCVAPNSAPVCDHINKGDFIPGASLISAFGTTDALQPGRWPGSSRQCDKGPFAACMTAPCRMADDGKTTMCECPIYDQGPFNVQSAIACRPEGSSVPSGFHFLPRAPEHGSLLHALLPSPSCSSKVQICYESLKEQLEQLMVEDTVSCPGQHQTDLRPGRCEDFGFDFGLGYDPIFTTVRIAAKHPKIPPPTDLLERCEQRSKTFSLTGKKALIVTTSHSTLGDDGCTSCKPTGAASPEMTIPYIIFKNAGIDVTIASVKGGDVPIDPVAKYFTHWDVGFWRSVEDVEATKRTPSLAHLNFTAFDLVYMVGGWGAAWDLGTSAELGLGISEAFASGKVLGSVCHGALGFINAKKADGSLLVNGTVMTGVTNRQVQQLGIGKITPMHPEEELKKRGAIYKANHGILTDLDQSIVVEDGNIITGQNQNSACETAQKMLDKLQERTAANVVLI